jgi:hypothetical protein
MFAFVSMAAHAPHPSISGSHDERSVEGGMHFVAIGVEMFYTCSASAWRYSTKLRLHSEVG